jgi:mannan endo-1,4-beta-mannosidase
LLLQSQTNKYIAAVSVVTTALLALVSYPGSAGEGATTIMSADLTPSCQNSTRTDTVSVLDYLRSISGKLTVSGIHNREPNSHPVMQTDRLFALVGHYPGLWSGDFLFSADDVKSRWAMIHECKRQWDQGSIVQLLLHVAPPNRPEVCQWEGGVKSHLSDEQWKDLVTDGGTLNRAWKARLDGFAVYLQYLKDNGVQVLFRPHHEMNQGAFWWGGRRGPEGTAKLYRLTHDYLLQIKGLTNLVWVWDMQDMSRDFKEYNPGDGYWDVFAFDVYGDGYNPSWYNYILPIVGNKPMAIGECDRLPTPQVLTAQPRWCFFMSWAELTFNTNTTQQIQDLYHAPNVVTRDRLPKFK